MPLIGRGGVRSAGSSATQLVATELKGLNVLVVDDQTDARDLIKRVLEDCAAKVTTAATADEALALVETERPDVLISDIGVGAAAQTMHRMRACAS